MALTDPRRIQEWLAQIHVAPTVSPEELAQLLDECRTETLWHEYKSGLELSDKKKAAATMRQYAAGFANSEGGLLIVGVADPDDHGTVPLVIDGCQFPLKQPLKEWADQTLMQLCYPAPKTIVVEAAEGKQVLIVATRRTAEFVRVVADNMQKFYIRVGSNTVPTNYDTMAAPEYLKADLVLGRRMQASIRPLRATVTRYLGTYVPCGVTVEIANEGLVPAKSVSVTLIALAAAEPGVAPVHSPQLIESIEMIPLALGSSAKERQLGAWRLAAGGEVYRTRGSPRLPDIDIAPLTSLVVGQHDSVKLFEESGSFTDHDMALLLSADNALPVWWSFAAKLNHNVDVKSTIPAERFRRMEQPERPKIGAR